MQNSISPTYCTIFFHQDISTQEVEDEIEHRLEIFLVFIRQTVGDTSKISLHLLQGAIHIVTIELFQKGKDKTIIIQLNWRQIVWRKRFQHSYAHFPVRIVQLIALQ